VETKKRHTPTKKRHGDVTKCEIGHHAGTVTLRSNGNTFSA
jgi:hypothetical protein